MIQIWVWDTKGPGASDVSKKSLCCSFYSWICFILLNPFLSFIFVWSHTDFLECRFSLQNSPSWEIFWDKRKWKCSFCEHHSFCSKDYSFISKSIIAVQLISLYTKSNYYSELNIIILFWFLFFYPNERKTNHFHQELSAFQANTSVTFSLGASLHFFTPPLGTQYHKVIRGINEKLHLTAAQVL